jgi:hypothetical protein
MPAMHGDDHQMGHLFSSLPPEQHVPADHPLQAIRRMTDEAPAALSHEFATLFGRGPAVESPASALLVEPQPSG